MYLLDTNVISELRKKRTTHARVLAWVQATPTAATYISVITLLELERGVLLMERRDAAQGASLRKWLSEKVAPAFNDRTLVIDAPIATRCAALHVTNPKPKPERDAMIAATAQAHGFTVVTRNVSDFASTGVATLNPWL